MPLKCGLDSPGFDLADDCSAIYIFLRWKIIPRRLVSLKIGYPLLLLPLFMAGSELLLELLWLFCRLHSLGLRFELSCRSNSFFLDKFCAPKCSYLGRLLKGMWWFPLIATSSEREKPLFSLSSFMLFSFSACLGVRASKTRSSIWRRCTSSPCSAMSFWLSFSDSFTNNFCAILRA